MVNAQLVNLPLGAGPLAPDARLLLGEQLRAHLVGVVGLQQLSFLAGQSCELGLGLADLLVKRASFLADVGADGLTNPVSVLVGELHVLTGAVVALDGCFDRSRPVVALLADTAAAAAANEILVRTAIAFGLGEHQPGIALSAVQAAAQVVEVSPGALATLPLGVEQVLDLLERRLVNQRLVPALVGLAGVADQADVVGVAQDFSQAVEPDGLFGRALGGPAP